MTVPSFQGKIQKSSYENLDLITFLKFDDVKIYAKTKVVSELNFIQKAINSLDNFFSNKKFVEIKLNNDDLLVRISDIALELNISKEMIIEAEKSDSLEELINLAVEAKHYNVDYTLFKNAEDIHELEYLGYLADSFHLTLEEVLLAKKEGRLDEFIETAKQVESKVEAVYKKLVATDSDENLQLNQAIKTIKLTIRSAFKVLAQKRAPTKDLEMIIPMTKYHSILVKTSGDSLKITGLFGKKLGEGSFGIAFQGVNLLEGVLELGDESVVKMPKAHQASQSQIIQEVKILGTIHAEKTVLGIQKALKEVKDVRSIMFPTSAKTGHIGAFYETDLKSVIASEKKLSLFEKASVAYQLLYGLDYLHSKGITHGDIKPANIFFNRGKNNDETRSLAFLADFGDAFEHELEHESLRRRVFTPVYKPYADEELSKTAVMDNDFKTYRLIEEKSDVYAMCATICQIYTKKMPYLRTTRIGDFIVDVNLKKQLTDNGANAEFADLLIQGLNTDYKLRPTSSELLEAAKKDMEAADPQKAEIIENLA